MKYLELRQLNIEDRIQIIDLFNYYIENSFAAFLDNKVGYEFYDMFLKICGNYPSAVAENKEGKIMGFGMLRPYNRMPAFQGTAEISYFIDSEYTGQGLGKIMLDYLEAEALKRGINNILAGISSLNEGSIRFHMRNGFVECGRFLKIGTKKDTDFDVVYMQKQLI